MGGDKLTASQVKKDIQSLQKAYQDIGKATEKLEHTIGSLQGKIDSGEIPNVETRERKPNEEKLEMFRTLFLEGKTVTEVAKAMGCATSYASQKKSEFGL
jgi:DNA invertase Pin-like site-specific DNA recombinase